MAVQVERFPHRQNGWYVESRKHIAATPDRLAVSEPGVVNGEAGTRPLRTQRPTMPSAGEPRESPRLWIVEDVCRFLGVSKRWVHERTRLGEIPCYRFGAMLRFNPQEIASWADKFHHLPGGN